MRVDILMGENRWVTQSSELPSRLIGVERRIPDDFDALDGPARGTVSLPVRLAWSGPTEFDVGDPGQRLTLYRTLLDCGQRQDIVTYVNPDHLRADWPRIRRLTARGLIAVWETRLPELAAVS